MSALRGLSTAGAGAAVRPSQLLDADGPGAHRPGEPVDVVAVFVRAEAGLALADGEPGWGRVLAMTVAFGMDGSGLKVRQPVLVSYTAESAAGAALAKAGTAAPVTFRIGPNPRGGKWMTLSSELEDPVVAVAEASALKMIAASAAS